jgi:hypothetical protein
LIIQLKPCKSLARTHTHPHQENNVDHHPRGLLRLDAALPASPRRPGVVCSHHAPAHQAADGDHLTIDAEEFSAQPELADGPARRRPRTGSELKPVQLSDLRLARIRPGTRPQCLNGDPGDGDGESGAWSTSTRPKEKAEQSSEDCGRGNRKVQGNTRMDGMTRYVVHTS